MGSMIIYWLFLAIVVSFGVCCWFAYTSSEDINDLIKYGNSECDLFDLMFQSLIPLILCVVSFFINCCLLASLL